MRALISLVTWLGVSPDIIVLRADGPVGNDIKRKISMFCNVKPDCVIENITLPVLYEAPLMLEKQHFSGIGRQTGQIQ